MTDQRDPRLAEAHRQSKQGNTAEAYELRARTLLDRLTGQQNSKK